MCNKLYNWCHKIKLQNKDQTITNIVELFIDIKDNHLRKKKYYGVRLVIRISFQHVVYFKNMRNLFKD